MTMPLTLPQNDVIVATAVTTHTAMGTINRQFGNAVTPASAAWPANNQAYLIPFQLAVATTFVEMYWLSGTSPGTANIDLGIYDDAFRRLTSIGATASTNTSDVMLPNGGGTLSPVVTLQRGRYYLAMSAAATTITVRAAAPANQMARAAGVLTMASAHPLPTTFTPASMGTGTFVPTIAAATVTNIL